MHTKTLKALSELLKDKTISSRELTQHYIDRIDQYNDAINAVVHIDRERCLKAADSVDQRRSQDDQGLSVLAGIPLMNKDIFCTVSEPTTCASKALQGYQSPFDATIIKNCRDAGMVMFGKCNMDEFAMGGSNENSFYGPTKNPWDLSRVPGGSSGGSAAAIAARLTPAVTGTDTGGSIRQPSAFCGITGIKPSYGVISRYGVVAFASSLDQAGPMACSAEDCALLLSQMASYDPAHDMTSVRQQDYDYTTNLNDSLKGLRVGLPKEYFDHFADADIEKCMQAAIDEFKKLGVECVEISLPDVKHCISAYYTIAPCEASSNLARFDGNIYGYRSPNSRDIDSMYSASRSEAFGNEVKRRIVMGTYALSSGYSNDYYSKAQNIRNLIRHDFDEAWQKVDIILAPTTPSVAFKIDQFCNDPIKMYQQDVFTIPVNLAELPALSMPVGFAHQMPVGMQIIGPRWQEKRILNCAHQFQTITDWHTRIPEQFA